LIKIVIKEENFKWHLEAFASELFIYCSVSYWNQSCPLSTSVALKYNTNTIAIQKQINRTQVTN